MGQKPLRKQPEFPSVEHQGHLEPAERLRLKSKQESGDNVINFEEAKENLEFKNSLADAEKSEGIQKLYGDPRLKIFHSNVMMFHDFKVRFNRVLPKNPNIVVLNPKHHVEMQVAFKNSTVTYLESTQRQAEWWQKFDLDAAKFDLESQKLPGKAEVDIFVAINDEDLRASEKLLGNIREGAWLLCRSDLALSLIETGNFTCKGTLDKEHGQPHVGEGWSEEDWKYAVQTDAEFIEASKKLPSGSKFVSYEEAKAALMAAGKPTGEKSGQVLDNYKELLRNTKSGNVVKTSEKADSTEEGDAPVKSLSEPKRELPFGKHNSDEIFVLKRKRH